MDKICYCNAGSAIWVSLTRSALSQQITYLEPVSNSHREILIKASFANQTPSFTFPLTGVTLPMNPLIE